MSQAGNSTSVVSSSDNSDTGNVVAIVALIISIIAFIATLLQVLQQYVASATGYTRCQRSVMGMWAQQTKRVPRPLELRFEVQFSAPVIFLAPANNQAKPVKDASLWQIRGTEESRKETWTLLPEEADKERKALTSKELIHTADNELATWVLLLSMLQKMEKESTDWENRVFYDNPPKTKNRAIFEARTLSIFIQPKKKSWDTMPASMTKPYATTTMCHLVELVAILGLHWKEFNRIADRYRAEGNGYIMEGSNVSDLGLVFSFLRAGRTKFEANRIIPCDEVKMLSFGFVPTIFCNPHDEDHLKFPFEEPIDWTALQLGSRKEIAETLVIIGCNTNTVNYVLNDKKKISHLFPVVFEILGMLGRTLHIKHSAFRMLPNPTIFPWDKKSFSLWTLLREFRSCICDADETPQSDQISVIQKQLEAIYHERKLNYGYNKTNFTIGLLDVLHGAIESADAYLDHSSVTQENVKHVVRSHIQEVLSQLNDLSDEGSRSFDQLDKLAPEQRQSEFMKIYFDTIRPEVVDDNPIPRRGTTWHPTHNHTHSSNTSNTLAPGNHLENDDASIISRASQRHSDPGFQEQQRNNIWCTLMFRMLCWLLLHDFHKKDIQVSKSELLGSRVPVYIV